MTEPLLPFRGVYRYGSSEMVTDEGSEFTFRRSTSAPPSRNPTRAGIVSAVQPRGRLLAKSVGKSDWQGTIAFLARLALRNREPSSMPRPKEM